MFLDMQKRRVNAEKLKQAIRDSGVDSLYDFAKVNAVSLSWLEKAMAGGYQCVPHKMTMRVLCQATKMSEDDLFPVVGAKAKIRTS